MGLADREYYREEPPRGFSLGGQRSMVLNLVLINVGLFVLNHLFGGEQSWLTSEMALSIGTLSEPTHWWKFLTYGFAHDSTNYLHVGLNMFVLYMFGRDIENVYGRKEFTCLYLAIIIFSGISWALIAKYVQGYPAHASCVGASGAVSGIFILFALHFPKRKVLLFFVIPAPAWVAGAMAIVFDMFGASQSRGDVAHWAHLAGIAFAAVYFFSGMRFSSILPGSISLPTKLPKRGPKLRVHSPPDEADPYDDLNREADRLLQKIHRDGEGSLTDKERNTLEAYSRRMRQKHQ